MVIKSLKHDEVIMLHQLKDQMDWQLMSTIVLLYGMLKGELLLFNNMIQWCYSLIASMFNLMSLILNVVISCR